VDVREVASAAAGDQDLLADTFRVVQQHYAAAAASCLNRAHHAGSARSQNYDINFLHVRSPLPISSNPDSIAGLILDSFQIRSGLRRPLIENRRLQMVVRP
jgi:hypothetical protein